MSGFEIINFDDILVFGKMMDTGERTVWRKKDYEMMSQHSCGVEYYLNSFCRNVNVCNWK